MTSEAGYADRPVAEEAMHTKNEVQPAVVVTDSWRVFGLGLSRDGKQIERRLVQANLYHTCYDSSERPTVALQATVMVEAESAIRLGMDLILQGSAIAADVGRKDLAAEAKALAVRRMQQLQQELIDLQV